ncbi:MAG: sigma-70 family RNA polymerase sigma factor [Bacillota bacterium]
MEKSTPPVSAPNPTSSTISAHPLPLLPERPSPDGEPAPVDPGATRFPSTQDRKTWPAATLAAWRHLPSLRDEAAFRPWLATIAVRLARRHLRTEHRRRQAAAVAAGNHAHDDGHAGRVTDALWVTQALAALPERHREVVILRYWGELTSREVARALGLRPGTVRYLLLQARRMVRDRIGESG